MAGNWIAVNVGVFFIGNKLLDIGGSLRGVMGRFLFLVRGGMLGGWGWVSLYGDVSVVGGFGLSLLISFLLSGECFLTTSST